MIQSGYRAHRWLLATLCTCLASLNYATSATGSGLRLPEIATVEPHDRAFLLSEQRRELLQQANLPAIPIILAVDDPTAVAVDPATGGIVLGSKINTTNCLRYTRDAAAPGSAGAEQNGSAAAPTAGAPQAATSPAQAPEDEASASAAENPATQRRLLQEGSSEELDFSVCAATTNVFLSSSPRINVLVKVNALLPSLPADALTVVNGAVVPPPASEFPSTVQGAFQVFEVVVDLGPVNTLTSISVAQNALASLAERPTGPSNTIVAVYDTQGPQPVIKLASGFDVTSEARPIVTVDFGERVLGANPADLVKMSYPRAGNGYGRWEPKREVLAIMMQ
jgi:hypothetical protein